MLWETGDAQRSNNAVCKQYVRGILVLMLKDSKQGRSANGAMFNVQL